MSEFRRKSAYRDPGYWSLLCAVVEVAVKDATGNGPVYYTMGNLQKAHFTEDARLFLAWCEEELAPVPDLHVRTWIQGRLT